MTDQAIRRSRLIDRYETDVRDEERAGARVGDRVRILGGRHEGREGVVDKVVKLSGSAFVTLDRRPRERTVKRELVSREQLEVTQRAVVPAQEGSDDAG